MNRKWLVLLTVLGLVILILVLMRYGIFNGAPGVIDENDEPYRKLQEQSTSSEQESCFACHRQNKGFSEFHDPLAIGCVVCHLGDPDTLEKELSHENMVRIPGNLSDAEETCGTCHPNELKKINSSLMTTNSGLVAVDKFIFGETASPDEPHHILNLGDSAADQHLRDLCANCHLGAEKSEYGAIDALSRGGGCNACHLNYSQNALDGLTEYLASNRTSLPEFHPSTDIFVNDTHCFGCHSRSGRISTNYMGWQETLLEEEDVMKGSDHKVFEDKRVYIRQAEDVHHASGMLCIDCHSSHEVMGDGNTYLHAEDAVKLSCSDCHFAEQPNTVSYEELDQESRLVFMHRDYQHHDMKMIAVKKDGHPLVNTVVEEGQAFIIGKKDGVKRRINPQGEVCARDQAHKELSCSACHSQWTSRCIGCHNVFDPEDPMGYDLLSKSKKTGSWTEHVFEFGASLPALGVSEKEGKREVKPAVPGMIMTIDHKSFDPESDKGKTFHRLYAPSSPHTTNSKSRSCVSCHADPMALGYGQGILEFDDQNGRAPSFVPVYAKNSNDGLPEDAWIPFLVSPEAEVYSTRTNFRPFSEKEQQRILTVGACLQCHGADSKVMKRSLVSGLDILLNERSSACIVPDFN